MENKNDNRTLIRIYAIDKNLKYEEVNSIAISENSEVLYWVNQYSVPRGRWSDYAFECFTSDGTLISDTQKNGWKTKEFASAGGGYDFIALEGVDPTGRIFTSSTGKGIQGVINAIQLLEEVSQFKSWEKYQLIKENEELQSKLELLTAERNKLQANLDNPD
jgi:hypothetical protein